MSKISIIIPVYNTGPYLNRCINSILRQTYTDIEIICIDDGSTDSSGSILDELSTSDSRMIVIHLANKGVSNARNVGLKNASGDFIGFVDSDDYVEENMFATLISLMKDETIDIASCGYYINTDTEIKVATNIGNIPSNMKLLASDMLEYIYKRDEYKGVGGYLWSRLFRRNILFPFEKKPLQFEDEYGMADDIVFVAKAMTRSSYVIYTNIPLYHYYQRNNSIVHDDLKQLRDMTWPKSYEQVLLLLKDNNIDSEIQNYVKRMYVYRCGRLIEAARKIDKSKIEELQNKIKPYLETYIETNLNYPDRIEWIKSLMLN